jgi:hypothetical protein
MNYYDIRRYIKQSLEDHTDAVTGEINLTMLAEDVSDTFDLFDYNWNIPQWVDELVFEIADKAGLMEEER